jgi:hypothetical protein
MATRKRTTRRSGLVGRAVTAGRRALRQAESQVPPDLRRQVERRVRDANKTVQTAFKDAQARVMKATSSRADVNNMLRRLDGLTKQAKQLARGTATRRRATTRRATTATATRRVATRTKRAAGATARKVTARRPAARRTSGGSSSSRTTRATTRTATSRRRATRTTPAVTEATSTYPTPMAGEMGETPGMA